MLTHCIMIDMFLILAFCAIKQTKQQERAPAAAAGLMMEQREDMIPFLLEVECPNRIIQQRQLHRRILLYSYLDEGRVHEKLYKYINMSFLFSLSREREVVHKSMGYSHPGGREPRKDTVQYIRTPDSRILHSFFYSVSTCPTF